MAAAPAWPYPRLAAHRGAGKLAPENTLASFRYGHARGYRMIDCQMATPHLLSLGAKLIPRPAFIELLAANVGDAADPSRWVDATPASADSNPVT